LSGTPDDAWLIALGAAVSDGSTIDWEQAERLATDPEKREIVRNMRKLAAVVSAHRSDAAGVEGSTTADTVPCARHWRHIVVFESIGAGAFGTVYRGWDPTLDREVAVKLLPKGTIDPASPLDEARNLARVRHSNVVVVYGADIDGDEVGIWMEYIEGRTLAQMVSDAGPMSAREVTGIGIDLCRALAALHGSGLLHRDIKPHNVMREFGGRIVLMDFSGAQTIAPDGRMTVTSGTPLYMAPELFESGEATFASDVYSLGILLFFLVSGQLPVEGGTVAALKRAHAEGHRKHLRDLRPDVPDATLQVIERAIAPEASQRYQTAGEFEHTLASSAGSHAALVDAASGSHGRAGRRRLQTWLWSIAALLVPALIAVTAVTRRADGVPTSALVTRFTIGPPYTDGSWPRVSPDGRFVVFGTLVEGRTRFWVRALDEVGGRALMNTTATESPFWSPDSETLCFFADGRLKRIPVRSGDVQPEVLADAPQPRGGDWSGRTILFSRVDGLYAIRLEANPVVTKLTTIDESHGEYQHAWPEFLPDGRRFLYIIRSSQAERTGLYLGSLDGGAPRLVMPAYSRVRYVARHLLFVRQGILMAQRFNPDIAALDGDPLPLSDRINYHAASDAAFDVSETGVLIYGRIAGEATTRLMVFDDRGRELYPLTPTGTYRHPRFSPDGRRVVAEKVDGDDRSVDLWLYDVERRGVARLTSSAPPDVRPVWSPNGERVMFASRRGAFYELFTRRVDTTGADEPLLAPQGDKLVDDWSPDGRYLSASVQRNALWILPIDPSTKPWIVRKDPNTEDWQSEFSPDNKWIAYTSRESGKSEVYVEPFPATGARWQISTSGGSEPHWWRGPSELRYIGPDGMLFAVSRAAGGWETSDARPLFRISIADPIGSGDYTVSPDGSRIVVNTFISDPLIPPIEVVVNWSALLAR
jgi:eukaryotic-like serine/threonine-protein kinase